MTSSDLRRLMSSEGFDPRDRKAVARFAADLGVPADALQTYLSGAERVPAAVARAAEGLAAHCDPGW